MHIHILGICGTFMGGLAQLARAQGHKVTGSDAGVYPPMSDQLRDAGIALMEGYDPTHLQPAPDLVVMGNALSRGNPAVEYVLDHNLPYTSGPQWLAEHVLASRWVLAVAGTHGKTTTSSMLAWILDDNGFEPGFLIGGVADNFGVSARLGQSDFFVIEADEYDTAFFDKRSKFVHYRPHTLVVNNLEFDHADIFADLAAIQTQFHHLVRTVPGIGQIIYPAATPAIEFVLEQGCWTPCQTLGLSDPADWQVQLQNADGSEFTVRYQDQAVAVNWGLLGQHNVMNGVAALAAAHHVGVQLSAAASSLSRFAGVKRRLELRGEVKGVRVYDDFAHHPTAIDTTLTGLRARVGEKRIFAVLEPRSNTMKMGIHGDKLAESLQHADTVMLYQPAELGWSLDGVKSQLGDKATIHQTIEAIIDNVKQLSRPGDQVLVMSNGSFGGIHQRLLDALNDAH